MVKKPLFISTSIPYVNARPHLGHALEFVQADAFARFARMVGYDVFFLSGTDDNALKNVLKAEEAGEDVRKYVNRHALIFKELLEQLNVSHDDFIRTSHDARHLVGAQTLWKSFKKEDVVKKEYEGLYCVGCEEFKTEKDLVNGECPEHPGKKPERILEENYFFKLGNYTEALIAYIEEDKLRISPQTRKNEVLSFLRGGLEDLSISRSMARAHGWGVPVPHDDSQVMYVWVDALSNYITALEYGTHGDNFTHYWENPASRSIHVIGKGISRFHAIYWPAMLLSAGVPLPKELVVHGYITVNAQKMSKTIGNVVDPLSLVAEYGTDAVRYYLLREVHPFEDGDFTFERFKEVYNANLANGLGNVVSRVMKLAETYLAADELPTIEMPEAFAALLEEYKYNEAMDYIWKLIKEADGRMTSEEPFKLIKTDSEKAKKCIYELRAMVYAIGWLLAPMLPETSEKILQAVRDNKKPEPLFLRRD